MPRNVRESSMRQPRPGAPAQLRSLHQTFDEGELAGWALTGDAHLAAAAGGRVLRISGAGRAVWHAGYFGDCRLDLRLRAEGAASVACRLSTGPQGTRAYEVRLEGGHITLARWSEAETRELATARLDTRSNDWADLTIWACGRRITVALDGRVVLEGRDERPLPPGVVALGAGHDKAADFDHVRLRDLPMNFALPPKPEDEAIEDLLLQRPKEGELIIPADRIYRPQVIPFEVHPYKHGKELAPINAGVVPPDYVHSWAIDLVDVHTFRLYLHAADDIQLHWNSGNNLDRLSVLDANGQVLQTFASAQDFQNKAVQVPPYAAGQHQRIYLELETSHLDKARRFRLFGLINLNPPTGNEEALVVGDDLNYDAKLGPFFESVDTAGKPIPIYQPWLPAGPHTFSQSFAAPHRAQGWYLLGANTAERERGFLTLLYYNERLGRLRVYLFNMNLPQTVTGYLVTFALRGRKGPDFVGLEGAFFPHDPRPAKWSRGTVSIPLWPHHTWIAFEMPMCYPMAVELPSLAGSPVNAPPAHYYRSVYEDYCLEAHRNVMLRITVQGFAQGDVEGDIVGKAIGEAVQTHSASSGLSISDLARGASAMFSSGKDWYQAGKWLFDKATDFYTRQIKAGDPDAPMLGAVLGLGAGAWSGALAAVGVGIAIYQAFFSSSEPLRLAIQMAIKAHLTGKVTTMFQPAFQDFFLPGRFSMVEAADEAPVYDLAYVNTVLPRYDRLLGLFGFRYDPTRLELEIMETCYLHDEFQDDGRWVFPALRNHQHSEDPSVNGRRRLARWLPVIYNPYAEIVPLMPAKNGLLAPTDGEQYDWGDAWLTRFLEDGIYPNQRWFAWLQEIAPGAHLAPEPGDKAFPLFTSQAGHGSRMMVKVFASQPTGQFWPPPPAISLPFVFPLDQGVWLEVFPEERITPSPYRAFQEIDDVTTHTFWDANVSVVDPDPNVEHYCGDPWPWRDVLYCWDIHYFYYGRTRKGASGNVALEKNVNRFQVPVTFYYMYCLIDYTDDEGAWTCADMPLKSRILLP